MVAKTSDTVRSVYVKDSYILQIELQLLLVGVKLMGQFVALMVKGEESLEEGQELGRRKMHQRFMDTMIIIYILMLGFNAPILITNVNVQYYCI